MWPISSEVIQYLLKLIRCKANSVLVSQNVKGVANIQRSGVGYGLEKNVSLRDGDILETKNGTTADLSAGEENILSLNANTELEAVSVKKGDVQVSLDQGELFTDLASGNEKILFTFGKNSFTTGSGVFAISQQTGSASLDVFKDEIDLSAMTNFFPELLSSPRLCHPVPSEAHPL